MQDNNSPFDNRNSSFSINLHVPKILKTMLINYSEYGKETTVKHLMQPGPHKSKKMPASFKVLKSTCDVCVRVRLSLW